MKNLYKKGKVHPSPPCITDQLSLLPAKILILTAALSPEDKEVLAYLISCCGTVTYSNISGHRKSTHESKDDDDDHDGDSCGGDHSPMFGCNCFGCYMSFWARWDTSPNRQVIHEIIEAYEEGLFQMKSKSVKKKERGKTKRVRDDHVRLQNKQSQESEKRLVTKDELGELESVEQPSCTSPNEDNAHVEIEKGTVRNIVSFIGEKIWGVWNKD